MSRCGKIPVAVGNVTLSGTCMQRVVSLIPSATEILCALNCEDRLVGRSHECDFPETVRDRPVCTAPAFDVNGSSREIDDRVRQRLHGGLSLYTVLDDVLAECAPDLIITQDQCDVCAASLADVQAAVSRSVGKDVTVISLKPHNLSDIWANIMEIATAMDIGGQGFELVSTLQARMAAIVKQAIGLMVRPTVASIEWIDPLMASGHWIPELVEMAGGRNMFGEPGKPAPPIAFADLQRANPDCVMVMPCGFDMFRARAEMSALTNERAWWAMRAVREERVFVTDGNQFFNRPGPRLVESLEILAEIIHPHEFQFGHEGRHWQVL